ncbi:hypothetical protein EUBSIR_02539 [[Eubacterium] siraeum DSM 15702]|uniref:Uncharacterized protein n=1 Tax=[Eubacterium] siraeum DSM 15702 TaxID=428128 RepID=B0MRQ7_9FIRM|nr:hypothetical protein EUBSIR_02539 [[Eubacterium] siraeum DSM 15702]
MILPFIFSVYCFPKNIVRKFIALILYMILSYLKGNVKIIRKRY